MIDCVSAEEQLETDVAVEDPNGQKTTVKKKTFHEF